MLELIRLLIVAATTVGVVLALIAAANARDRRRAVLLETAWCLAPRELRDMIAIHVRFNPLWMRYVVEINLWGCPRHEVSEATRLWSAGLSPGVRLLVEFSDVLTFHRGGA